MIRFSKPRAGGILTVKELKCLVRASRTEYVPSSSLGYVFPEGLTRFKMVLNPAFEGAPQQAEFYAIQTTNRLSESLRLLYIGRVGMGVQPPPGNATSLLQPISKALCEMIDKEIGALREDTEDALLKDVPFMAVQFNDGENPIVKRLCLVGRSLQNGYNLSV
ncbi:hypothetical protein Pmar_PMAR009533 [Perkinsus marinus ATCC 50983]|uniref:Uncharacterized protein n=1 Tax=Perkinsus marinus (strain ATCC 50983 / TXsc) TaxID=423536 RepID=C5KEG1_PERM5|nr:hypothetical protein Pmar_PMAR009533 [Perkinsus marinus ATCC 50983]EER17099.1 hypothetical protein Pmar_PMAR009533 [Perkinsus marinus ATCC 50983]|eukprot:XP_002785303.1 hypothetical protein Pmar_PMAR009533 [Perkinsus marinus ATCC 50983]